MSFDQQGEALDIRTVQEAADDILYVTSYVIN